MFDTFALLNIKCDFCEFQSWFKITSHTMVFRIIILFTAFIIFIVYCDTEESKGLKVNKLKIRSTGLIKSVAPKENNNLRASRYKRQLNVSTDINDHKAALRENRVTTESIINKKETKYPKESKLIKYVITQLPPVKKVKSYTEIIHNKTELNVPSQNLSEIKPLKTKGNSNNITELSKIKSMLLAKLEIVKNKILLLIQDKQNNTLTSNVSKINTTEILKPTNNIASSNSSNLDASKARIFYLSPGKIKLIMPQVGIINGIPMRIYQKETSSNTSASSRFEDKNKLQNKDAKSKLLYYTNHKLNGLERGQGAINSTKEGTLHLKDESQNLVTSSYTNKSNDNNEGVKQKVSSDFKIFTIVGENQTIFTGDEVGHEIYSTKTNAMKPNVAIAATKNETLQTNSQLLLTNPRSAETASLKYGKLNFVDVLKFSAKNKTVNSTEFKAKDNTRRFKTLPVEIRVSDEKNRGSLDQNEKDYDKLDDWVNDLQIALDKLFGKVPSSTFKPPYVPINEVSEISAVKSLRALSKDGLMFNDYGSDKL